MDIHRSNKAISIVKSEKQKQFMDSKEKPVMRERIRVLCMWKKGVLCLNPIEIRQMHVSASKEGRSGVGGALMLPRHFRFHCHAIVRDQAI